MIVVDKDVIAVSISDVYLDSHDYVLYTDCEVFMPAGFTNKVTRLICIKFNDVYLRAKQILDAFQDFKAPAKFVEEPVVSFLHAWGRNYYHSIAEATTRWYQWSAL